MRIHSGTFIEKVRGVKFVYLSPSTSYSGNENVAVEGNSFDIKPSETIWDRDPGDAPWFDFSDPHSNKTEDIPVVYKSNSTQTVLMFDINTELDKSTETDAAKQDKFAAYHPIDIDTQIRLARTRFVKTGSKIALPGQWLFGTWAGVQYCGIQLDVLVVNVSVTPPQPLVEPGAIYELVVY